MWVTLNTPTSQSILPTTISFIPLSKLPKLPMNAFSTVQLRRRNPLLEFAASSQDTDGLGHPVFSALEPGTDSNTTPKKPNKGEEISGSDILRALQKVSAKKAITKKQHKKKRSSELKSRNNSSNNGKKFVDLDKVRPITIKSDWATRLTDLEKRLQEFSAF